LILIDISLTKAAVFLLLLRLPFLATVAVGVDAAIVFVSSMVLDADDDDKGASAVDEAPSPSTDPAATGDATAAGGGGRTCRMNGTRDDTNAEDEVTAVVAVAIEEPSNDAGTEGKGAVDDDDASISLSLFVRLVDRARA
jgi:hypothetical protein